MLLILSCLDVVPVVEETSDFLTLPTILGTLTGLTATEFL